MLAAGGLALLGGGLVGSLPGDFPGRAAPMPERLVGAPGAVAVIDRDTLSVAGHVVRIRSLDATGEHRCPAGVDCGARAVLALAEIVRDRQVRCVTYSRDEQGRPVADCDANGIDLADALGRDIGAPGSVRVKP